MKYYWKKKKERKIKEKIESIESTEMFRELTLFDFKDQLEAGRYEGYGKAKIFIKWYIWDGKDYLEFKESLVVDFSKPEEVLSIIWDFFRSDIYKKEDAGNLEVYVTGINYL
jgi:hypothetical protein